MAIQEETQDCSLEGPDSRPVQLNLQAALAHGCLTHRPLPYSLFLRLWKRSTTFSSCICYFLPFPTKSGGGSEGCHRNLSDWTLSGA